jgi:hypothetical protein
LTGLASTWEAAPGLTLRHGAASTSDPGVVRSDVLCVLSATARSRWPSRVVVGDFVELELDGMAALAASPVRGLFDPAALGAVRSFFENGGRSCRLVSVCVESEGDLLDADVGGSSPLGPVLGHLRTLEDVGLLAMPLLGTLPVRPSRGALHVPALALQGALLDHCQDVGHRFLLLDAPFDLHERALLDWVGQLRDLYPESAAFGGAWYPWLYDGDRAVAPSGVIAGVIARTDAAHPPWGVHWPPANQVALGVTHAAVALQQREAALANEAHVNTWVAQPGRGLVAWGARTLASDPRWLHINTRRVVSLVAEQLRRDNAWVVFEHQRPELWEVVTRSVRSRLDAMWSAGLLSGARPQDDTRVRCDAELNPPEVRERGEIRVSVVLRPVTTTEHILVDLHLAP